MATTEKTSKKGLLSSALFWIIAAAIFIALLWKSEDIGEVVATIKSGALIPLIVAFALQFCKYFAQCMAYRSAYAVVGVEASSASLMPLIFASVFLNTFTGGTAMAAMAVDDCRRRGASVGKSASVMVLTQAAFYAGFVVIMVIVFMVMQAAGYLQMWEILLGMVFVIIVAFFCGVLIVGGMKPNLLGKFFAIPEKIAAWFMRTIRRPEPKPWAANLAESFGEASVSIKEKPRSAAKCFGNMTLSSAVDLLCFIAVGFAFNVTQTDALMAGFVMSTILILCSPTPQGIGFVEAGATLAITAYGVPATFAAAVLLVYRVLCFWLPFLVGAILLRRTNTFKDKETDITKQQANHARFISIAVGAVGLFNVLLAAMPTSLSGLEFITKYLSVSAVLDANTVVIAGIALILLMRGLMNRNRTSWACAIFVFVTMILFLLLGGRDWKLTIVPIVMVGWLFFTRNLFTETAHVRSWHTWLVPILVAIGITFTYGTVGYLFLGHEFGKEYSLMQAMSATFVTIIPSLTAPTPIVEHGAWFLTSLEIVWWVCFTWAIFAIFAPIIHEKRFPKAFVPASKRLKEIDPKSLPETKNPITNIGVGILEANALGEDYFDRMMEERAPEQDEMDSIRFN